MNLDWSAVEARARKMSVAELHYARLDAAKTADALEGAEVRGKDAGYYRDEASVYAREMDRRRSS